MVVNAPGVNTVFFLSLFIIFFLSFFLDFTLWSEKQQWSELVCSVDGRMLHYTDKMMSPLLLFMANEAWQGVKFLFDFCSDEFSDLQCNETKKISLWLHSSWFIDGLTRLQWSMFIVVSTLWHRCWMWSSTLWRHSSAYLVHCHITFGCGRLRGTLLGQTK